MQWNPSHGYQCNVNGRQTTSNFILELIVGISLPVIALRTLVLERWRTLLCARRIRLRENGGRWHSRRLLVNSFLLDRPWPSGQTNCNSRPKSERRMVTSTPTIVNHMRIRNIEGSPSTCNRIKAEYPCRPQTTYMGCCKTLRSESMTQFPEQWCHPTVVQASSSRDGQT